VWTARPMPSVVLIDGRSGSGKTTLAGRLAADLGASRLHLENLYPGWDGLAEGSRSVAVALDTGEYRQFDWHAGAFTEIVRLDPSRPLVIEGCGAVTVANLAAARRFAGSGCGAASLGSDAHLVRSIWLECPEALRRERAIGRDGELYAPHWERWARQERAHFAAARPIALVDEIIHVDG